LAAENALPIALRDHEHDLVLALLDGLARGRVVVADGLDLHAIFDEVTHQIGRTLRVGNGELQRLVVLRIALLNHQSEDGGEQKRREQWPEHESREQRAPVAQILAKLLGEHRQDRAHYDSPSPVPMSCTKASSRLLCPVRSRMASGVPEATTLP
jgi:hypothetical protein